MLSCFDPSALILVYGEAEPANMTFEQPFKIFESTGNETEIGEPLREKWKNKRTLCPIAELNPSLQTMTTRENCAIVGNGGFLIDSGCGAKIDSHDFVLRAYIEKLNGYTDDVGNKASMVMINDEIVNKFYDILTPHSNTSTKEKAGLLRYLYFMKGAILWYPLATDNDTAEKLQKIATVLFDEKLRVKFAFSLDSAVGITKR